MIQLFQICGQQDLQKIIQCLFGMVILKVYQKKMLKRNIT